MRVSVSLVYVSFVMEDERKHVQKTKLKQFHSLRFQYTQTSPGILLYLGYMHFI